jgi:LCP family protein required for cell wall assembly
LVAFLIAAVLTAYLAFIAVRDFVTSWELTSLPGVSIHDATPTPDASGVVIDPEVPLQPVGGPTPVPWDGAKRVTLLVMGLDYRDWAAGEGPPRTDTMILFTIDPINQTAGMLSIPRDLWVNIPGGFSYGRINTAYQLGEAYQLPGGGPTLAMKTVEELLGVPIDYYAQIDFGAFVRFIDEIGGVKVDVPEKITIDPLGDDNIKTLKPGVQTLPGELALAYARARKTEGGDFDRAQRQQQVILGIRNQIVRFDQLPRLIAKSGALYSELSSGVHTNLSLDQSIRLAWLASQIPEDKIKRGIIGPPKQVSFATSPDGTQQVLKPITDQIRLLRDEIFTETGPASPAAASMDPTELVQAEAARISILNGTTTPGLAARTSEYLRSLGITVAAEDNAQNAAAYTEITFYTGKPYTVKYLVDLMQIEGIRIHHLYDPASPVDVAVTLGEDWTRNNPMP